MAEQNAIENQRALLAELMRREFLSFLMRAFSHIRGGAQLAMNWHMDAIAYQLERVRKGQCRRLLVTIPPRNLKSIMISVAWVAWRLGLDPTLNFVCISYSNELSAKHARNCRAIMQADWYRRLFPRTVISSRSAVHDFETTLGGGRFATSIGGTVTGRGGDIIIIDDPIKPGEALSETTRKSVNEWFKTTLASRLDDKRRGVFITVMQRLHQHDAAGMLLTDGDWDELKLPAIAMVDATIPLTRGRVHHRRSHDILHPAHEPLAELMRIKRLQGSTMFEAQYQQEPVPAGGNVIKAAWLRTYADDFDPSSDGQIVQSWDTASKEGTQTDYSACITAHVLRNEVRTLDVFRARLAFPDLKRHVIRLARQHRAQALLIEDQASGTQLIQALRSEQPQGVPNPIARKPEGDKLSRMEGVSGQIEGGQLLLPNDAPWLAEFKSELLGFPSARYDDQADALSQLMAWVLKRESIDDSEIVAPILFVDGVEMDESSFPDMGSTEMPDPWSGL